MSRLFLTAAAVALCATAATAEVMRDSDGDVIAITYYSVDSDGEVWIAYADGGLELGSGGPVVRFDTADGPVAVPASPQLSGSTLRLGDSVYRVEAQGNALWLRNGQTGERVRGQRLAQRPDAVGRSVNPRSFGLD